MKDITGNKKFWEALRPVLVTKELNLAVDEENLFDDKKMLEALVRYFLSNFYFSSDDSPSKTMKNVSYFI